MKRYNFTTLSDYPPEWDEPDEPDEEPPEDEFLEDDSLTYEAAALHWGGRDYP